jgi:hypothetical protein
MKLLFSRQIFEKNSYINFHKNPSSGSRVASCGRTDGHHGANSRFRNFANAPKKRQANAVWGKKMALFCENRTGYRNPNCGKKIQVLLSSFVTYWAVFGACKCASKLLIVTSWILRLSSGSYTATQLHCVSTDSFLSFPLSRQLSWDVPADAGLLCDKTSVLGELIKETLSLFFIYLLGAFAK